MGRDQTRSRRGGVDDRVDDLRRNLGLFSFSSSASESASPFKRQRVSPELEVRAGGIVEWLLAREGAGALTAAMPIVSRCLENRDQGFWAMVDSEGEFYAPALSGWNIDPRRTLIVRPRTVWETCWAVEQCLRCPDLVVTGAWLVQSLPARVHRRWQLAAEEGGGVGLIFRPASARGEAVWADLRMLVTPVSVGPLETETENETRRVQVEVLYRRGSHEESAETWEVDHAAGLVRLVPQMAHPKSSSRSARSETV